MEELDLELDVNEIRERIARLSKAEIHRLLRFATLLGSPGGFSEAYQAFLDENGGIDAVDISGVDRFMNEWEESYD